MFVMAVLLLPVTSLCLCYFYIHAVIISWLCVSQQHSTDKLLASDILNAKARQARVCA